MGRAPLRRKSSHTLGHFPYKTSHAWEDSTHMGILPTRRKYSHVGRLTIHGETYDLSSKSSRVTCTTDDYLDDDGGEDDDDDDDSRNAATCLTMSSHDCLS